MLPNNNYIKLGHSDIKISKVGLGCMGMSEFYGKINDNESIKVLHKALELGVNHFDTADMYGFGHNEQLLAKAFRATPRDKVIIASKCGFVRKADDPTFLDVDNNPEYIKKCCDKSLKRLNTDYIDIFYIHRFKKCADVESSIGALADLVKDGKIRSIGLSEVSAKTIEKAHKVYPISAVQSEYSLWSRDPEKDVLPICKKLGITFVAFGPLGHGYLSGKIKSLDELDNDDFRRMSPRLQEENIRTNMFLVEVLNNVAKQKKCSASQVALAWLLEQGENIVAIPGTKQIKYIEENTRSLSVRLSKDELQVLNNILNGKQVIGNRVLDILADFAYN